MLSEPREGTVPLSADGKAMPRVVKPMLAQPGPMPPDPSAYAYEFKWDGYRALLFCKDGHARVQSRNLRDLTADYPELQGVAQALRGREAILDGEIVVLDAQGRPSFEGLQARANYGRKGGAQGVEPVTYFAFDLLWLDGRSLMSLPLESRRAALEGLNLEADALWVPQAHRDGEAVQDASRTLGLEGIVAKRLASPYVEGQRTAHWIKVKNVLRQEVVVAGWTPGEGSRRLGALLVGTYDAQGRLVYGGRVGSGLTQAMEDKLLLLLAGLGRSSSPFDGGALGDIPRGARYAEPRLVAEVAFTAWTREGLLRQPSFKGLREDKAPREVVREEVP